MDTLFLHLLFQMMLEKGIDIEIRNFDPQRAMESICLQMLKKIQAVARDKNMNSEKQMEEIRNILFCTETPCPF